MGKRRKYIMKKGDKYNMLTVIQEIAPLKTFYGNKVQITRMVLCRCICNRLKNIKVLDLVSEKVISCGCQNKEIAANNLAKYRHNSNIVNRVGRSNSYSGYYGIFVINKKRGYYEATIIDNGARVDIGYGKDPIELNDLRFKYLQENNLEYKVV